MRKNLAKTKSNFSIQSFEGGYDKNYSYLLTCLETISSIIVDVSIEFSRLQPFMKTNYLPTVPIVKFNDFHQHFIINSLG